MSALRLQALLRDRGFIVEPDPGFISGTDAFGERLSLFTWGNNSHAEQALIPRSYLVVCTTQGRWRLPLVDWHPNDPVSEQLKRPWADVLAEFDGVFLPAVRGLAPFPAPGDVRYTLSHGLGDILREAGLEQIRYNRGVRTVLRGARRFEVTVAERALRVQPDSGDAAALELTREVADEQIAQWLADVTRRA